MELHTGIQIKIRGASQDIIANTDFTNFVNYMNRVKVPGQKFNVII